MGARVPRAPKRRTKKRATRKAARRAATPKAPKRRRSRRSARKARKTRAKRRTVRKARIKYGSMRKVWNGSCDKTKGGLMKKDLMINKRGKVVSKKQSMSKSKGFKKTALGKWVAATQKARKELGLTGFVACKKGTAYYKLSKKYYN